MHHRQKALRWAIGSWSLFIAENLILSEHRTELIQRLGDDHYHTIYGLCSTIACGTIAYSGYNIRKTMSELSVIKVSSPIGQALSVSLLGLGFLFLSQSAPRLQIPLQRVTSAAVVPSETSGTQWKVRCPFDFHNPDKEIFGIDRVTRHSGLWSLGFIGAGFGMLSASLPAQVWLSMPLMVALIGGEHTDSRYRRHMGGSFTQQEEMSSNIPFWGILSGKQGDAGTVMKKLVMEELKGINGGIALALAGAIVFRQRGRGNPWVGSSVAHASKWNPK